MNKPLRSAAPPSVGSAVGVEPRVSTRPSDPAAGGEIRKQLPVPANIEPFVRVLGVDKTIEFLLAFGGAELYIARRPQARGQLSRLIGPVKTAELAEAAEQLPRRIPLAKAWIAQVLLTRGVSVAEIARRLRVSDVTVRGFTKAQRGGPQLDLFTG